MSSRRARSKREATFLEEVRNELHLLTAEMANIKSSILDLHTIWMYTPFNNMPQYDIGGQWEIWVAWNNLEIDPQEPIAGHDAGKYGMDQRNIGDTCCEVSRTSLLAYRHVALESLDPSILPTAVDEPIPHHSDACRKCLQRSSDCVCCDLFCRSCVKTAAKCSCPSPMMFRRKCCSCGHLLADSLHDDKFLSDLVSNPVCSNCASTSHWEDSEEYFCLQGASECQTCFRVDSQHTLDHCNGQCETLHHLTCMNAGVGPLTCSHNGQFYLCTRCKELGIPAQCDLCVLDDEQAEVTPDYWQIDEIKIWIQVTIGLAHGAIEQGRSLEEGLSIIDERWIAAARHIPESVWPTIEESLQGIRDSTRRIEARREELQHSGRG